MLLPKNKTSTYHDGGKRIMKKLDELMNTLDQRVDQAIGPSYRYARKYFTIFSATLLSVIVLFVFFKMYYTKPYFVGSLMHADILQVEKILHDIDTKCEILAIQSNSQPINFLTIRSFAGSMVGGINLAHPQAWQGPYLEQNPTYQGKFYDIVKAKDGYFIVPGTGVMLPNGAVMGRDVIISTKTSVEELIKPGGYLYYKGIKLAIKASFKIGDWSRKPPAKTTIDSINDSLERFNEAMPFTQNSWQKQITV